MTGPSIEEVATEKILDQAYAWLCCQRRRFPDQSDVWTLRHRWAVEREQLHTELIEGTYRFTLLSRVRLKTGEEVDLWSARDALVLKGLALVLARHLPISGRCCHVKGNTLLRLDRPRATPGAAGAEHL